MRLLPGNTYLADPALRSLLKAWLRPATWSTTLAR